MKTRTKRRLAGAAAVALLAALAVGGTLSYLTDETEKRVNNFTFASDGVDARLTEPGWDGIVDYEYEDDGSITPVYDWLDKDNDPTTPDVPVYGYTDGDKSKPITDKTTLVEGEDYRPRTDSTDPDYYPEYGDEQAMNMIPGSEASKNPVITNTGITKAWVAAKITFVYAAGADVGKPLSVTDMAKITDAIDIDYAVNTGDNWVRKTGDATSVSQEFLYKEILSEDTDTTDGGVYGDTTTPIFTKVSVKTTATNAQLKALEDMGGFAIWIEGFAVQSDVATDFSGFQTWAATGVVFNNTPTADVPADVSKPGIVPAN